MIIFVTNNIMKNSSSTPKEVIEAYKKDVESLKEQLLEQTKKCSYIEESLLLEMLKNKELKQKINFLEKSLERFRLMGLMN